jgi:hypothetical protein
VHFYSKILGKTRSNVDTPTRLGQCRAGPRRAAPPRRPCLAPPEASSAPRALEVLPLLARYASRTPRPTGRTDRRRTGGHRGVPTPLSHAGQDLGLHAALMAVGAPRGRPPYKREPPVRGGPVPRGTPSIPWTRAGKSSNPRSSDGISWILTSFSPYPS